MGFYWTGTGFEEREVPLSPPLADSATTEPQQPATFEDNAEEASSTPTRRMLHGEQRKVQQKMAQEFGNHSPVNAGTRDLEGRKKDGRGPEQFDPLLGIWVRAQEIPSATSTTDIPKDCDSGAQPDGIAGGRPQQKPARENGSMFKWTSWFRSEPGQGLGLVTPPPAEPAENESPLPAMREDDTEQHSSAAAQESAAVDAPISAENEGRLATAASPAAAPEVAVSDAPHAVQDESISAPTDRSAIGKPPGGSMLQSAAEIEEAVSVRPRSDQEMSHPSKGPEGARWFVLNRMLGGASERETSNEPGGPVPVLEVFSLAGGAGKTSIVATLGRALAARGERVVLVEATPLPSLQYFFGTCDSRPGELRTFRPPTSSKDPAIRLASVDPASQAVESGAQGPLAASLLRWSPGASRVIVDVSTGSIATLGGLSKFSPLILVPLVPDVNAVVSASSIDLFFQRQSQKSGRQPNVFYVLNQFDSSLPLHWDVREVLQQRLGDRLLPFVLERTSAVSEALAEGMTIMDYAPRSSAAAGFTSLAMWLEEVMAPAPVNSHGRWSER